MDQWGEPSRMAGGDSMNHIEWVNVKKEPTVGHIPYPPSLEVYGHGRGMGVKSQAFDPTKEYGSWWHCTRDDVGVLRILCEEQAKLLVPAELHHRIEYGGGHDKIYAQLPWYRRVVVTLRYWRRLKRTRTWIVSWCYHPEEATA